MDNPIDLDAALDELKYKGLITQRTGENSVDTIKRFAQTTSASVFMYLSAHTKKTIEDAIKHFGISNACREITLDEACIIAILREDANFGASDIASYAMQIYESINKYQASYDAARIAASQIVSMMSNPNVGLLIETNDRYTLNPNVELN